MAFEARQLRAISYCAKKYDYRLSLSAWPIAYFVNKYTGETVKIPIDEVLDVYDQGRKEDAKERARIKRQQKR